MNKNVGKLKSIVTFMIELDDFVRRSELREQLLDSRTVSTVRFTVSHKQTNNNHFFTKIKSNKIFSYHFTKSPEKLEETDHLKTTTGWDETMPLTLVNAISISSLVFLFSPSTDPIISIRERGESNQVSSRELGFWSSGVERLEEREQQVWEFQKALWIV